MIETQPSLTCSKLTMETLDRCEICLKLTIKTPERCEWCRSGVFIVNFEHFSNRMEKREFQKTLNEVRENDIVERQLTADRNMQIRRYMNEDEPQIDY